MCVGGGEDDSGDGVEDSAATKGDVVCGGDAAGCLICVRLWR